MSASESEKSYVYVLTNPAMPGLVKIGRTGSPDPEERARKLYSTGVPVPFDVEYAGLVPDANTVEQALHNAFKDNRVNPRREFFRIEPDQAIGILKLFDAQDVTGEVDAELNEGVSNEEKRASERFRKRRPPLNFEEMDIPIGSELVFAQDEALVVTVAEPKKVWFEGRPESLSYVTMIVLGLDYNVAPTRYWTYAGKSVQEIYDDTHPHAE